MHKLIGTKQTAEHIAKRRANSLTWAKRSYSNEHKEELRKKMLGNKKGFQRGQTPWTQTNKGQYHHKTPRTEEHKEKLRLVKLGSLNPAWVGGLTKSPYGNAWTKTLKLAIRQRDNFICQKCGTTEEEHLKRFKKVLFVNHIDYDKKNCNSSNLNTLCGGCNSSVNTNREYWTEFFRNQISVA